MKEVLMIFAILQMRNLRLTDGRISTPDPTVRRWDLDSA